jgi:hypothetical protein
MKMYDCPKFEFCSSPICPLLASVSSQSLSNGERVCYYLTEYQKANSEAYFGVLGLTELYKLMAKAMDEINSNPHTNVYLRRALKLATQSSSKMAKGISLRARYQNG